MKTRVLYCTVFSVHPEFCIFLFPLKYPGFCDFNLTIPQCCGQYWNNFYNVCTAGSLVETTARFVSLPSLCCSGGGRRSLRTCTNPSLCIKGRSLGLSLSNPDSLSLRLPPLRYSRLSSCSAVCRTVGFTLPC